MEQYPHIEGGAKAPIGVPCIAFYKYDGSNLRWEWSPKKGWHKFGTRTELFDDRHPLWSQAIPLFAKIGDEIVERVKKAEWKNRGIQRITAFTEFFGPSSFAGVHVQDEPKELRLIDVYLFKQGMMKPKAFVETFGDLPYAAQVVYKGNLSRQFIADVRMGLYPVWEGVVAKGDDFMVKIKTGAYLKRLNEVYGTDYRAYWE
jgi:hypothetical protein